MNMGSSLVANPMRRSNELYVAEISSKKPLISTKKKEKHRRWREKISIFRAHNGDPLEAIRAPFLENGDPLELLLSPHSFRPTVRNLRLPRISSHIRRFSDASIPPPTMESTSPSDIYVTADARGIGAGSDGGHESSLAVTSSMGSHFGGFIVQMEKSGNIRERIRSLASEIEATNRVMHAGLLLAHQPLPIPEVLKKAESQRVVLRDLYGRLAEILHECPGQYYR
ncbi:hypothetical protein KSP40_PGU015974 [Platanthera guangdongensis]|uniref:Ribosomal protein S4 n=1 Tax=Platanthera guangdongensis TaxID=2320717 RepID=A0ABR2MY89_9ASPA